eukprot:Sdes_comp19515_c0_seq3m11078
MMILCFFWLVFNYPLHAAKKSLFKAVPNQFVESQQHHGFTQLPCVINTWGFQEGNQEAYKTLHSCICCNSTHSVAEHSQFNSCNCSVQSVVEGCSVCEELRCDGTVGWGGSPDENGETCLDAILMDGYFFSLMKLFLNIFS